MPVYRATCDHPGCDWSAPFDLDAEITEWRPPVDTGLLDAKERPIISYWEGQRLEDAYMRHYVDAHASDGVPPMLAWVREDPQPPL